MSTMFLGVGAALSLDTARGCLRRRRGDARPIAQDADA